MNASTGMIRIPLWARDGSVKAWATVDEADLPLIDPHRWCLGNHGYAMRTVKGRAILMHRHLLGLRAGDKRQGDHLNRDRLDNRRENLRITPGAVQNQNRRSQSNGKSPYRGVSFDGRYKEPWLVSVHVHATKKLIRTRHATEIEAAEKARELRLQFQPFAVD